MKSKNKIIQIVTISAIALIFLLVVSLSINLIKLAKARSIERKLNAQLTEINSKISDNDEYIANLESDDYLDWMAREHLNMKGKDEEAFKPKEN